MAFVRWRGNSAALLATVYEEGRSRQVLLAALGCGYAVPNGVREYVSGHFPTMLIDWDRVNDAMAKGPQNAPPLSNTQLSYLEVEQRLREWASQPITHFPGEQQQLLGAANALSNFRGREEGRTSL